VQLEYGSSPRHHSRRQRRSARRVLVDRTEPFLEHWPINRPRQLYQRMVHVDHRVEPRSQQIALARFPSFLWSHQPLAKQSRPQNHNLNLQGIPLRNASFWQTRLAVHRHFRFKIRLLSVLHGRLNSRTRRTQTAGLVGGDLCPSAPHSLEFTSKMFRARSLNMPKPKIAAVSITLRACLVAAGPYLTMFATSVLRRSGRIVRDVILLLERCPTVRLRARSEYILEKKQRNDHHHRID
jgi:hypothetical protein